MPTENPTRLRRARSDDAAAIRQLLHDLGYELSLEETSRRFAIVSKAAGHSVFIAECDGEAAGLLHVYARAALEKPPEAVVEALVVGARFRRRGVGRDLMAAAEEWASRRGYDSLSLYSGVRREDAHAFYRSLGYRLVGTSHSFRRALAPGPAAGERAQP